MIGRRYWFLAMAVLAAWCVPPLCADLKRALAEPDLGRRSRLAIENAKAAYQSLRDAYDKGETEKVAAAAKEIEESVDLADVSLKQTGKNPRKSPKYFKEAEISTRDLLRRLEMFQKDMNFEDRAMLDPARKKVQEVHDDLLVGLMEGKKP
jgi:hypothetical protein